MLHYFLQKCVRLDDVVQSLIRNLALSLTAGPFFFQRRSFSPLDGYDIQITLCIFPITIPLCRPSVRIIVISQRHLTVAAINKNSICYQLGSPFRHAHLDGREHSAVSGVQNTLCEGFLARRKCNSSPLVFGVTYCSYCPSPLQGTRIVVQYCWTK